MVISYQYSRISDPGTIRLILLQPSTDLEQPLHCSLIHKSLETCENDLTEHYIALSYVWGSSTTTCSALVDEKSVSITSSLDCALRHLRHSSQVLRVWADGICIDQQDVEDRNQQVRLMGSVYSLAHHTIIFLGPSDTESDFVLKYIYERRFPKSALCPAQGSQETSTTYTRADVLARPKATFLTHPWFTRVWVLQELVLSRNPWVQKGICRVKWDDFCSYSRYGILPGLESASPMSDMLFVRNIYWRDMFAKNLQARVDLEADYDPASSSKSSKVGRATDILRQTVLLRRGSAVSDPRDMIYGHFGLEDSNDFNAIAIDYNKSIAEVFEDFTRYCIKKEQSLDILKHLDRAKSEERPYELPSWVPNWTLRHTPQPPCAPASTPGSKGYHVPPNIPRVIILHGWRLGRINYIISNSPENPHFNCPAASTGKCAFLSSALAKMSYPGLSIKNMDPNRLPKENGFIRKITETIVPDPPTTMMEACKALCVQWCIYVNSRPLIKDHGIKYDKDSDPLPLIASLFDIDLKGLAKDYVHLLEKFTTIYERMQYLICSAPPTSKYLAVLDTGALVSVTRYARVGDYACDIKSLDGLTILRQLPVGESREMTVRIEADEGCMGFVRSHTFNVDEEYVHCYQIAEVGSRSWLPYHYVAREWRKISWAFAVC